VYFELALNIIITDVLCWDTAKEQPTKPGLFGTTRAYTIAVEEQARKTLHAHILVWVDGFNQKRERLHGHDINHRQTAANDISSTIDSIMTCKLVSDNNNLRNAQYYFPHPCRISTMKDRLKPRIVDDQRLRHLRYQDSPDKMFAYCEHCTYSWTSEEFIGSFLINSGRAPGLTQFPDNGTRRLKAMTIQYQRQRGLHKPLDPTVIDAAYNYHVHTTSCFGKHGKKKRKCEASTCRYRLPRRKKQRTTIQKSDDTIVRWLKWDGTSTHRFIYEFNVKRGVYDQFQNVSCPAISHSKLSCNTNISPVTPGPVAQYQFKYHMKGCQEEEREPYEKLLEQKGRIVAKISEEDATDRTIALQKVLYGAFTHQSTNIIAAPLASFLTRNKERFLFSHTAAFCPLRDLVTVLDDGEINASIQFHGKQPFMRCEALNYLCRPGELEHLSPFDFFRDYETIRRTQRNAEQLLDLVISSRGHPATRKNTTANSIVSWASGSGTCEK